MPNILHGEPGTSTVNKLDLRDVNYDYEYPAELNLRPDTMEHKDIVKRVLEHARASHTHMTRRHGAWNDIDKTLTAYIPLSDEEDKSKSFDSRKPVSIVFPHTHAILESLLSYMTAAFLPGPVFRYEGVGPDDVIGAILLTKAIDLQCTQNKVGLNLHTQFRDGFAYGIGASIPSWKTKRAIVSKMEDRGFISSLTDKFIKKDSQKVEREEVVFEGNTLVNIDPYNVLLDPNVPAHAVQEGEFFGWVEHTNLMAVLEEDKEEGIFNGRYVKHMKGARTAILNEDSSGRETRFGGKPMDNSESTNPVDIVHMYIKIIPEEWGLGNSEYPEKWYFQIAGDRILLQATPIGLNHGDFPVTINAPDFDGYSTTPVSRLEMLYGLQGTLDWLFNAHVANVRKAVNNMFVYDPYLINSNDLEDPKAGGLIRTRKPAWGKGVKDAIQQLNVQDVTRQNIADSSWLVQWMEKIGSTDGAMMGSLRNSGPDRLSSAEYQGTAKGAFSRLERLARITGMQMMQDLGHFFAAHTQQYATQDTYVNVLGDWVQVLLKEYGGKVKRGRLKISPKDLLIYYNVMVRDGSVPGGNYSQVWERMFEVIAQHPELGQQFDLVRIFKHIARNNGAKNTEEFVKVQTLPDEQLLNQVQKGNVVPIQESRHAIS